MTIRYLAHSCFLVTTADGTRVLFDPYEAGAYDGALKYGAITEPSDVVVTSHEHPDHCPASALPGNPTHVAGLELAKSGRRTVKGVSLRAVHTYHDPNQGKERGENAMTILEADGLRLCHAGDLGHLLDPDQVREIGALDVLLLPVGGFFTIDAAEATRVVESLRPRVTIPMHYKTPKVDFPIGEVDGFLAGKTDVQRPGGSTLTVPPLPPRDEVVVLEPAL